MSVYHRVTGTLTTQDEVYQMSSIESALLASALADAHLDAHAGVLHAAADAPPVLVLVLALQALTQRLHALLLEGAAVVDARLLPLLQLLAVWLPRGRRLALLSADHRQQRGENDRQKTRHLQQSQTVL